MPTRVLGRLNDCPIGGNGMDIQNMKSSSKNIKKRKKTEFLTKKWRLSESEQYSRPKGAYSNKIKDLYKS